MNPIAEEYKSDEDTWLPYLIEDQETKSHRSRLSTTFLLPLIGIVFLIVLIAFPELLTPYNPFEIAAAARLQPPSTAHWFGTDRLGRDILSRIIVGARYSLLIPSGIAVFAVVGGLFFGVLAGYFRRLDNLIMRVMDGLMSFPFILLAVATLAILGREPRNIVLAVGIVYLPMIARIVRSSVLALRETTMVEAAVALGATDIYIMRRHMLPNMVPQLIVQASYFFARGLLTEAALSFLGLGLPPDMPSWGFIIGEGRPFFREAPWTIVFPGLTISLVVVILNVVGDNLRDRLDPRLRRIE